MSSFKGGAPTKNKKKHRGREENSDGGRKKKGVGKGCGRGKPCLGRWHSDQGITLLLLKSGVMQYIEEFAVGGEMGYGDIKNAVNGSRGSPEIKNRGQNSHRKVAKHLTRHKPRGEKELSWDWG